MADNSFADLLQPGEAVVAQIAGEGRTEERGRGLEHTWWHVALTPHRVLVLRMKQAAAGRWDIVERRAGLRAHMRIAHFPRTNADTARLTIEGAGDRVVFVDVDRPPLLPQVQPFLAAWGGPVAGGESVAGVEIDTYNQDDTGTKTFLYIAGGLFVFFLICCGCLGIAGVLRQASAMFLGF